MKKLFVAVAAVTALLLPISAQAGEKIGFYVAPKFVLSVQHSETKFEHGYLSHSDFNTSTTQTHAGGALAVGYDFSKKFDFPIRAELEYAVYGDLSKTSSRTTPYMHPTNKAEVGVKTLLLNLYADLLIWNGFTPYVGAGIGFAFVENKCDFADNNIATGNTAWRHSTSHTKRALAGQLGLGCSYAFNETVSLDLGYRFLMIEGENAHSSLNRRPLDFNYGFSSDRSMTHTMKSNHNYMHQFMFGFRVAF